MMNKTSSPSEKTPTSEQFLRHIRQRVFDYPNSKANQVMRVLDYLKTRVIRCRKKLREPTLPFSGLTRKELAQTGTCEPDWY